MFVRWWPVILFTGVLAQNVTIIKKIPNDIKPLLFHVNATTEYVLIYTNIKELNTVNPFRIKTYTNSHTKFPVMVSTRQSKSVTAWAVPMMIETKKDDESMYFNHVSKIMCHDSMDDIVNNDHPSFSFLPLQVAQNFIITLSTASVKTINVHVELEEQKDFYVALDKKYSLAVSPSEPKYVFFRFDKNTSDTVIIEIDSEDEFCFTVSVQDSRCPVLDTNKDIKYEGLYQTINLKGSITINKRDFKDGFFLVFVAKPDNFDCSQENSYIPKINKFVEIHSINITTIINFKIKNSITFKQYFIAIGGTTAVLVAVGLILVILALIFHRFGTISRIVCRDQVDGEQIRRLDATEIEKLLDSNRLVVSNFARFPIRIKKRSYNYLSQTLNIALFYSIPVVQLVVTYQRIVNFTGNQDMCYYNFMCAHPARGFSDFNHIFSNAGYVVFGIIFIFIVIDRHRRIHMRLGKGIPVHYGIFHAMGVALIIEGLLSACYHICPSQSNYQFDTSFMYVMAVLCMIKLYQNRHPEINSTAYTTFTILGGAIFMAMIGVLNGSLVIWILFALSYTALCVVISFKIYFMNYVISGLWKLKEDIKEKGFCGDAFIPVRKARFILLIMANLANYSMVITGVCLYNENFTDFATFLLYLLLGNTTIHTIFYTVMKLLHRERICVEAIVYGILSIVCWAGSGVFFLDAATLWTVTPAESRHWNQECILLDFYDKHDIWHLLSAPALFFVFMFLMCLDDDIIDKDQSEIPVF